LAPTESGLYNIDFGACQKFFMKKINFFPRLGFSRV
jgi:hypothetical protein